MHFSRVFSFSPSYICYSLYKQSTPYLSSKVKLFFIKKLPLAHTMHDEAHPQSFHSTLSILLLILILFSANYLHWSDSSIILLALKKQKSCFTHMFSQCLESAQGKGSKNVYWINESHYKTYDISFNNRSRCIRTQPGRERKSCSQEHLRLRSSCSSQSMQVFVSYIPMKANIGMVLNGLD